MRGVSLHIHTTAYISSELVSTLYCVVEVDLLPWLTAFFVSLGFGFEYGILLGVVVSLLILLYPWARPQITVCTCLSFPGVDS